MLMAIQLPEKFKERTLMLKEECAEILVCSVRKIEYLADEGKIHAVKTGYRTIRVTRSSFEKYLSTLK